MHLVIVQEATLNVDDTDADQQLWLWIMIHE